MIRSISIHLLIATFCFTVGCSSTSRLESHSYALQNADVEHVLISRVIDDEFARLGADQAIDLVHKRGGKLDVILMKDDVAIVTITPRGHAAIRNSLDASRHDIKAVREK